MAGTTKYTEKDLVSEAEIYRRELLKETGFEHLIKHPDHVDTRDVWLFAE
jgi:hypothetical protein